MSWTTTEAEIDQHPTLGTRQQTLRSAIACTGVGLHSGSRVEMTLRPAEPGSGILFRRTDAAGTGFAIPARFDRVVDTQLCTVLGDAATGLRVGTVEHVMAALAGCGVDNAVVEVDGPELPIMDGSAADFVFLVESAGVVAQAAPRLVVEVLRPVRVSEGAAVAALLPAREPGLFSLDFEIDFPAAAVARQRRDFALRPGAFAAELARARTFGFLEEVEKLWSLGLARGGSFDNAIVVSGARVLNRDGLRFADEFVRHKLLDSVGDLALAGLPISGHFHGRRSGHRLNNALLRALFADPAAFRIVEADEVAEPAGLPRRAAAGRPAVAGIAAATA